MFIPKSFAFFNLDPAFSPAITIVVFFETLELTFAPRFIRFSFCLKINKNKKAKIVKKGFDGNLFIDLKFVEGNKDDKNSFHTEVCQPPSFINLRELTSKNILPK